MPTGMWCGCARQLFAHLQESQARQAEEWDRDFIEAMARGGHRVRHDLYIYTHIYTYTYVYIGTMADGRGRAQGGSVSDAMTIRTWLLKGEGH